MQRKAAQAGVVIDIGEFPPYSPTDGEIEDTDPQRPVRLVAHAVARAADRIAPLRKISRHLEGQEAKSGMLSDLTAAAFELYGRNSDQLEHLVSEYIRNVQGKTAARKAQGGGAVRQAPFGSVNETEV